VLFRRHARLTPASRTALADLLGSPTFELIPLKNAMDQAAYLPAGATVSVTASPTKGLEATVDLAARLRLAGFTVVPHLSARMVRDRAHLAALVAALDNAGIDRAFIVGGDEKEPGAYVDGLALLRELAEIGHPFRHVGIPAYPQGHAFIADGPLLAALHAKAEFAQYMTTQLCFDPSAISSWIAARRAEGLTLPVHIGVPGVAEPQKLLALAARIGVADTHRFLAKNVRFVARLVRSGGFYRPDALLEGIAPTIADADAKVSGFHLYLFNAVEVTERWRVAKLETLARGSTSDATSRGSLLDALAGFPDRLAAAARAATAGAVPPGEWTPEQVVRHLVAVELDVHQGRLRDLETDAEPQWTWAEPGPWPGEPELDLEGVVARFGEERAATVGALRALDEDGWARAGRHATFGRLDVAGLVRTAVDHDEEHLRGLGRD
jgi:methylenetetrahydrofolate reductase (NADPH)